MRVFVAFAVLFALTVPGTLAEAQAPPSNPESTVATWIGDIMAPAAWGQQSEQTIRDYYRRFLSRTSQAQVTEDQFVSYWQRATTGTPGGYSPELAYSISDVAYNQAHDKAHVTYRYRLFASESSHTGSNDVVLEGGVWKMILWPEIVAEMQKQPATRSRPSVTTPSTSGTQPRPSPATTSPSVTETPSEPSPTNSRVASQSVDAKTTDSVFEVTATPLTSSGTLCITGRGCGTGSSSITEYGAHLRLDLPSSPLGFDLRYLTGSSGGGTDNYWVGYVTYRWEGPQETLRFGAGYESDNEIASFGSFTQSGPVVGVEGVFKTGKEWPGTSFEAGAFYLPSLSGTLTVLGSSVSGTGTGWLGYAGIRYTTPSGGFTLTGGYNFLNINLAQSGGSLSENSSGPYFSVGIAF